MATVSMRIDEETGKPVRDAGTIVWRCFWKDETTGKRVTGTVRATCKREALILAQQLQDNRRQRAAAQHETTLAEYYAIWIEERRGDLQESSRDSYRKVFARHILPRFGTLRLLDINANKINAFLLDLNRAKNARNGEKLSGATCHKIFRALSLILKYAMFRELIPFNPADTVRLPKRSTAKKAVYYQSPEIPRLWQAIQAAEPVWRVVYALAFLLGVRRSELLGLRWSDYDFISQTLTVQRAAMKLPGVPQACKPTKNTSSVRVLGIPDQLAAMLNQWKLMQGGGIDDYIAAYPEKGGLHWVSLDQATRRFKAFTDTHDLRGVSLHGLRHTFATMQLAAGTPIHEVQESLGHAQATTTMNIYGHVGGDRKERLQQVINAALENPEDTAP